MSIEEAKRLLVEDGCGVEVRRKFSPGVGVEVTYINGREVARRSLDVSAGSEHRAEYIKAMTSGMEIR